MNRQRISSVRMSDFTGISTSNTLQISQQSRSGSICGELIYYKFSISTVEAKKRIPKNVIEIDMPHEYDKRLLQALYAACQRARTYSTVESIEEFYFIIQQIITADCLGSAENVKGLLKLVKKKMSKSAKECMYRADLLLHFEITDFPYYAEHLKNDLIICKDIFLEVILWIFSNIVDRMIYKFFRIITFGSKPDAYITQRSYQSFQTKVLNNLLEKKFIEILPQNNKTEKSSGKLVFFAKKSIEDCEDYRAIFKSYTKGEKYCPRAKIYIKDVNRQLYIEAKKVCPFIETVDLHTIWKCYVQKVKDLPIYGVKLDISDAFGNVNIGELHEIISNTVGFPQRYFDYIRSINNVMKIDFAAPDNCYKWTHGLLQGERLSAGLFSFYRSHRDNKLLRQLNTKNAFIFRATDDYLYCNTDPSLVKRFLEIMMFDNQLNLAKTTLVLPENIEYNSEVFISGALIDLKSKMVKVAYKLEGPLHHRFRFWNIKLPILDRWKLVEKQTCFLSNQIYFGKIFHCKSYNNKTIRCYNFFSGMIVVAYRFDGVLQSIEHPVEVTQKKIYDHIKSIIKEYTYKIAKNWGVPRDNDQRTLLEKVSLKAFLLVLQRRNQFYFKAIHYLKRDLKNIIIPRTLSNIFRITCGAIPKQYSRICMQRQKSEKIQRSSNTA